MKKLLLTFLLLSTSFLSFATVSDDEVSLTINGYTGATENMGSVFTSIDFSLISLDFLSYVLKGVYAGFGLGLALFAMHLVYKFFKSFSKGSATSNVSAKK